MCISKCVLMAPQASAINSIDILLLVHMLACSCLAQTASSHWGISRNDMLTTN